MGRCKSRSIKNAAILLTHLHQHPRNPYKTLQGLIGMSTDGMAKYLMLLKQKGLIVRTAYQQYTLTQKSAAILQKVASLTQQQMLQLLLDSNKLNAKP